MNCSKVKVSFEPHLSQIVGIGYSLHNDSKEKDSDDRSKRLSFYLAFSIWAYIAGLLATVSAIAFGIQSLLSDNHGVYTVVCSTVSNR
jgi:hypothetical protein